MSPPDRISFGDNRKSQADLSAATSPRSSRETCCRRRLTSHGSAPWRHSRGRGRGSSHRSPMRSEAQVPLELNLGLGPPLGRGQRDAELDVVWDDLRLELGWRAASRRAPRPAKPGGTSVQDLSELFKNQPSSAISRFQIARTWRPSPRRVEQQRLLGFRLDLPRELHLAFAAFEQGQLADRDREVGVAFRARWLMATACPRAGRLRCRGSSARSAGSRELPRRQRARQPPERLVAVRRGSRALRNAAMPAWRSRLASAASPAATLAATSAASGAPLRPPDEQCRQRKPTGFVSHRGISQLWAEGSVAGVGLQGTPERGV